VCVKEWLSGTNIIIRICERKEVQSQRASSLPCTSFRTGPWYFIHFLQAIPRLRPSFFQTWVVDKPRWGNRVLWIFVVPIKFSLCSHQVHNGFPNMFQVGPHFVPYALPNFILLGLGANIGLICLRWILLYSGSLQSLVNCWGWANERDSCKIKFWTWSAPWTN
jgi:hypothetical protein